MTTVKVEGSAKTLAELFRTSVTKYGGNIALEQDGESWTYAEIGDLSEALARSLQADYGIKKGERVALMMTNTAEFIVSAIAIVFSGATLVNVNPFYTERELEHQLNDAGVKLVIVGEASQPTLEKVVKNTPVETILCQGTGLNSLEYAINAGPFRPIVPDESQADDVAILQYTGGTTGLSKGAVLRHRNICSDSQQVKLALSGLLEENAEVVLTALPLYHIFAFTVNFVTFFSLGARNVLISDPSNVEAIVKVMRDTPITAMTGVNTLYNNILNHDLSSQINWRDFKLAIGGGSAILPATSGRWEMKSGVNILEGYGMTETSPVLTVVPPSMNEFTSTVGLPLPYTEIKIFDDDNNELPNDEEGEICIKGPQVMSGYWGREDLNDVIFNPDGYFKSGDIGLIDERGFIKIVDRKKDMILVSGFNVYPNEVEAVASLFPTVTECACIGVPDERSGEAVKLFVISDVPEAFDPEQLKRYCRVKLAGYKTPKIIELVKELPKSTVGKILRRELKRREQAKIHSVAS